MNVKNIVVSLVSIVLSAHTCKAQFGGDISDKEIKKFKASEMMVVRTGNKEFDGSLSKILEDVWKVTNYKFIDKEEFHVKVENEGTSFLFVALINMKAKFGTGMNGTNENVVECDYGPGLKDTTVAILGLINGGKKLKKYSPREYLAFALFDYKGMKVMGDKNKDSSEKYFATESDFTNATYRLKNMAQSILNVLDITEKKELKLSNHNNSYFARYCYIEYYQKQAPEIKNRTLLVCEDYSYKDLMDLEKFKSQYPYKYEFCKKEKIEDAIKNKDKNYCYFFPVHESGMGLKPLNYMFVFDPADGKVLYANDEAIDLRGSFNIFLKKVNKEPK